MRAVPSARFQTHHPDGVHCWAMPGRELDSRPNTAAAQEAKRRRWGIALTMRLQGRGDPSQWQGLSRPPAGSGQPPADAVPGDTQAVSDSSLREAGAVPAAGPGAVVFSDPEQDRPRQRPAAPRGGRGGGFMAGKSWGDQRRTGQADRCHHFSRRRAENSRATLSQSRGNPQRSKQLGAVHQVLRDAGDLLLDGRGGHLGSPGDRGGGLTSSRRRGLTRRAHPGQGGGVLPPDPISFGLDPIAGARSPGDPPRLRRASQRSGMLPRSMRARTRRQLRRCSRT